MSEKYQPYKKHESERETKVRIIERTEKMGKGAMSKVDAVRVRVETEYGKRELEGFVIKKYSSPQGMISSKLLAERSLENYGILRKLNFPVPPTFRLDPVNNRILMTNVNMLHPDSVSITTSETTAAKGRFVEEISNFEDIAKEILEYADGAAEHAIDIGADAYNLTVPRTGRGAGKLFITDMELVEEFPDKGPESKAYIREQNIDQAQRFLYKSVVVDRIPEDKRAPYIAVLDKVFGEKKASLGLKETSVDRAIKNYLKS